MMLYMRIFPLTPSNSGSILSSHIELPTSIWTQESYILLARSSYLTKYTIVRRSRHNTSIEFSRVACCRLLVGHLVPTTKKVFRSQTAGDARRDKASIRRILYCVHEVLPYIVTYLLLLFASECIFSDRSFSAPMISFQ